MVEHRGREDVTAGLYAGPQRAEPALDRTPPPGQHWLLTVALDLYLAGAGHRVWLLALVSGLIFAGGLLVLGRLGRQPRHGG
jgi:hypothetical protein